MGRWYVCMLHRGSNCSLARTVYGRIMRCVIISSCQSAATSEIVKRSWACVHRGAALYRVPDLYLLPLPYVHQSVYMSVCLPRDLRNERTNERMNEWIVSAPTLCLYRIPQTIHSLRLCKCQRSPVILLLQPRWCCTGNMMRDLNMYSQRPATSPHESVTLDRMHPSSSSIVLY